MIVFVPDVVGGVDLNIDVGCLCTVHRCNCLRRGVVTLVDVGLSAAAGGVLEISRYFRLIRTAVYVTKSDVYAVVPDVFCNTAKTVENFIKYNEKIKQMGARSVLVLQHFYADIDAYWDLMQDAELVALPMRRHCDVRCAEQPRLCAERAERALRALSGVKVHLLGPAAKALKLLATGGVLKDVYSFDTMAYRMAPNSNVKTCANGRWMITRRDNAATWLREWLRSALGA